MSVLIKGMEMPKTCSESWALDDSGDYPLCRITGEQRGYNFRIRENRMDKCPLVEVPTPHGRLIDVDALLEHLGNTEYKGAIKRVLMQAPVIIEAELKE